MPGRRCELAENAYLSGVNEIVTSSFKLPRRVYERFVAMRWMRRRWWVIAVPIAALVAVWLATADLRWLLVALMYLFIITPGVLTFAYFSYLLNPAARLTALNKRITILPFERITITYLLDDEQSGDEPSAREPEPAMGRQESAPRPPEVIPWSDVTAAKAGGGMLVIELRPVPYPRFLLIPLKAIDGELPEEWMEG